jgi:outer membrane autotransporter protein
VVDQTSGLFLRTLRGQASSGVAGIAGGPFNAAPLGYSPNARPASLPAGIMAADTPDVPIDAYANERVARAWLAPVGQWGAIEADGNAGELDWWTAGVAGGYERPVEVSSGQAYVGFGLGYLRSHGSVDARRSSLDADGFHIGAYGGWAHGPWSLAGALAYAASSVSTSRRIVFGDIDETAEADYWSHTIGFSGEAAYRFDLSGGTTLSPFATLDAGWSGHGGFDETGAGALNLTGGSESWARLDTGLGLALQHVIFTDAGKVALQGRIAWEHAFADVVSSQTLAFAGGPSGFEVRGPDAGRDRVRLGLGLSFEATEDLTIRAGYTGLFSDRNQSHGAGISFKVRF